MLRKAPAQNTMRGLSAIALAMFCMSFVDAAVKWLGGTGFHAVQIVFLRYVIGLIALAPLLWLAGRDALVTERPFAHILRALLIGSATVLFFWSLKYMPLVEAIAIAFTAPLFITALSVPVLGERVGVHRWIAVVVGFVGMLVIVRPGSDSFRSEAFLVLSAALFFALAVLYTRKISATESNLAILTYTSIVILVATAPFAAMTWRAPEQMDVLLLLFVGLLGSFGQFMMIVAYRNAPAAVNAPMDYTALIWTSILGWLIWHETPDWGVWLGAAIIVCAGLYIVNRETRYARRLVRAGARAA